jgi:uncharacterized protein
MKLLNQSKNNKEIAAVIPAFGFVDRLVGLLKYPAMPSQQVLWLRPCNNVHTCLMRFSIDVVFVDKNLKVQSIKEKMTPFKFGWNMSAHSVFEMSAGSARAAGIEVGDQLHVVN